MPSNDARMLVHTAVPTAAVGVVAAVIGAVVAGGAGALGAVVGSAVVILFMGCGLIVLNRTAKSFPHLFQAMGLLLYTTQILVLFVFVAAFKDTTLFDPKVFATTLVASTLIWVAAQARATMKSKTLYVDPDAAASPNHEKPQNAGSSS